jgi:threonine dehydrogenase-like Zn-dependent dehydrogenase
MRSLVLNGEHAPRYGGEGAHNTWRLPRLQLTERPEPAIEADDEVLVTPDVVGICGSDVHASECGEDGYVRFSGPARLPVVLGHELAGRVVAVGGAVRTVGVGQIVAAESVEACGHCPACRRAHPDCCHRVELVGLTRDGAFARVVRLKAAHVHPIDAILERYGEVEGREVGSLLEPVGVALKGLTLGVGDVQPHDTVVVVGAGPIGLACVAITVARGARAIAFDRSPERVTLAVGLGAEAAEADAGIADAVRDLTGGAGATIVVDASGCASVLRQAIGSLCEGGTVVYLGRTPEEVTFDPNVLVSRDLRIVGSRGHIGPGIFARLIDLIGRGDLDVRPLVTSRFGFDEIHTAFERARQARDGKVIVRMKGEVE